MDQEIKPSRRRVVGARAVRDAPESLQRSARQRKPRETPPVIATTRRTCEPGLDAPGGELLAVTRSRRTDFLTLARRADLTMALNSKYLEGRRGVAVSKSSVTPTGQTGSRVRPSLSPQRAVPCRPVVDRLSRHHGQRMPSFRKASPTSLSSFFFLGPKPRAVLKATPGRSASSVSKSLIEGRLSSATN